MRRDYLINLRNKKNESQQSVANALGVSRQYYSMIEKGERQQDMDISILCKLASHFQISINNMLKREQAYSRKNK